MTRTSTKDSWRVRQKQFLALLPCVLLAGCAPRLAPDRQQLDGAWVSSLVARVASIPDSAGREALISSAIQEIVRSGRLPADDSVAYLLYRGAAARVSAAGDFNRWNPVADTLSRVPGTSLFQRALPLPRGARVEYKLVVDSTWIIDPLNPATALGGFGANSELTLPGYTPPPDIVRRENVPRGKIDTLTFSSRHLTTRHPLYVYTPASQDRPAGGYPVLVVLDGGGYLDLASFDIVLDNVIAEGRITPVIAAFLDPRTGLTPAEPDMRMSHYALNDSFIKALADDLLPLLAAGYGTSRRPEDTGILGASLGGLTATYAAILKPEAFGLCAAQSPSYWWEQGRLFALVEENPPVRTRFWIDSGTINDAAAKARQMSTLLSGLGCHVTYSEFPEGHNWGNWRARLAPLLEHFWGSR